MRKLIFFILTAFLPVMGQAHNVIASVFVFGDQIEGEVALSNGTVASNLEVTITADDGTPLGITRTDDSGYFTFRPTKPVTHHFTADMGAGHVANLTMTSDEVAKLLGQSKQTAQVTSTQTNTPDPAANTPTAVQIDAAVLQPLRDEIRALRHEITAARSQRQLHSILGGIGYVLGIFGFGFYLAATRKLKAKE